MPQLTLQQRAPGGACLTLTVLSRSLRLENILAVLIILALAYPESFV